MLKSRYVEDLFLEFMDLCDNKNIELQHQDQSAANSFYVVISTAGQLTKNQANFLIKILQKYKLYAKMAGLDFEDALVNPEWRTDFRLLDLTKKIFVEKDELGEMWICVKFPFALKEVFEKEISPVTKDYSSSIWDADKKIRRLKFYNFNLIEIFEFATRHNFDIDDTFMIALGEVEEIWQNEDEIAPYCVKHFGTTVDLCNASEEVVQWWEEHRTCEQGFDLLTAKAMGYPLKETPENLVEKIAGSTATQFWLKSLNQFFELQKTVNGVVAIILNQGEEAQSWVKEFCIEAEKNQIDTSEIRVCFRLDKDEDRGFNQWVKDSGYGGKVEGGKVFIFQKKPPKWLFSEGIDVKIIVTNSLYPVPSATTQTWMDTHTCVCFVGDIKAAHVKEKKIVEL